MKKLITKTLGRVATFASRSKAVFACKRAETFIDSGFKILIVVVIAALLLAGLYALFGDVIMPKLTERVTELFNYSATP